MKLAIDIVKSILLPKLEKDANFDNIKTDAIFWESFAAKLIDFEKDETKCKTVINNLGLNNPEKIISKLSNINNLFINELAENYVLGNESEAIDLLMKLNNQVFNEEVRFLSNLEEAITEIERDRIKAELPTAYDSLVAELNEKDKKETKVISFKWFSEVAASSKSWINYAAAACIILTAGIATFTNQTGDNNVVTTESSQIETYPLVAVSSFSESSTVIEETSSAFASKPKVISIVRNDQTLRIASIVRAIEKYQIQLQKILPNHKVGDNSTINKLNDTILSLNTELELLKIREKQYVFNGKLLTLFVSSTPKEDYVLFFNEIYYLKKADGFYKLSLSKEPQNYKKETDTAVLNDLKEILFRKYGI
jgi:hypothetical protein